MASLFHQVVIRSGTVAPQYFSNSGMSGDWRTFDIPFSPNFSANTAGRIRVFASAAAPSAEDRGVPAVPVVGQISAQGFTIWARNCDIIGGSAGFNWIAVVELPEAAATPAGAVFGVIAPQYFTTAAKPGDWINSFAPIPFSRQTQQAAIVVATPTNTNIRVHAAAAVPVIGTAAKDTVSLAARNSDVGPGLASFNYLAVQPGLVPPSNLMVDIGRVASLKFSKGAQRGDWQTWNVNFSEHFVSPPTVIVCADNYDSRLNSYAVAAVGMANDVTPNGFTLAARNSDLCAGWVAFSWLAIGYVA